jgi:hypothetical protein
MREEAEEGYQKQEENRDNPWWLSLIRAVVK